MEVINLGAGNSILNAYIAQMRDKTIQKNRMLFRTNLKKVGAIFGYEISKRLSYSVKQVETPLGIAEVGTPDDKIVLGTIFRAGLPLYEGLMEVFTEADSAYLAAFREYDTSGTKLHINAGYCATPPLDGKVLIFADTMLATGSSLMVGVNAVIEKAGRPKHINLVCPIASARAVENLQGKLGDDFTLWVATIDPILNDNLYIVPGLGDAGDLAFGPKL
ncbi:MAG: uracil phosphoribosyltransferase [Bacteroidales bacterium]|nr:uracil phosphoribosyltransferase [Bacteroidales bacterium]